MKRNYMAMATALLLALTMCFSLTACSKGDGTNDVGGEKSWPTITYLTANEKYTGSGEITHVNEWSDGSVTVDINGTTQSEVSAYVTKLIAAGWSHIEGSPIVSETKTSYGFEKIGNAASIEVIFFNSEQTRSSDGSKYNLEIQIDSDGGWTSTDYGDDTTGGGDDTPGDGTEAWFASVINQLNNKSFSVYSGAEGSVYESTYVEILGDLMLVKMRLSSKSEWDYITLYDYSSRNWKKRNYNEGVWGVESSANWVNGSVKSEAFDMAVIVGYGAKYGYAKAKTATGSKVINGKTCSLYDTTVQSGGVAYGTKYYLWNDVILGEYAYIGANTYNSSVEIRGITEISALSMSPSDNPQTLKLTAPDVTIDEYGIATWADVANAESYLVKINGGTVANAPSSRTIELENGQTIQIKAEGNGIYTDSDWSTIKTYTASSGGDTPSGGDDVCGECGQSDGNHLETCSHHPDYVCDAFGDVANNDTWEPTPDGLCDSCGKAKNLHMPEHEHSDANLDGYCDGDDNYYLPTFNLAANFTFVYLAESSRETIIRDLGKIYWKSEHTSDDSIQNEYLYAWSDSEKCWIEYYNESESGMSAVWKRNISTYSNENEIVSSFVGGLMGFYALESYKQSDWTKLAVQTDTVAGRTCSVYSEDAIANYYIDNVTRLMLKAVDYTSGSPQTIFTATSYVESGTLGNSYDVV